MAGIMDGFEAATKQGSDFTQAGMAQAQPAAQQTGPIGTDVFGSDGYKFREAQAATRSVDKATGTVSGQLDSILAQDGLHMQRARSNALAMASDLGLRNSSIAVGAAQGALIDRATPIATTDAQIYDGAARDNQAAQNQANVANANSYNSLGGIMIQERGQNNRLATQQSFQAGQADLDRAQQSRIQQLQEQGMDRRQAEQIAAQERQQKDSQTFQAGENQASRDQQLQLAQKQIDADNSRLLQQHELTLKQMGYQSELNNAALPKQFAANIAQQTLDKISAVAADGNLDAAAKKAAIQNIIDAGNATASLGAKLYGVEVPTMTMPGYAAPASSTAAPNVGIIGDGSVDGSRYGRYGI